MNGLKIGVIVLSIGLFVSAGFATITQLNNMKLNEELSSMENDLDFTRATLQETEQELNTSQLFILTYMKAMGAYMYAWEKGNDSHSKFNLASDYYINNSWDNAIQYFIEAKNGYVNASQKWSIAASLYKETGTYTTNATYQNYFNLHYAKIMAYSYSSGYYSNYTKYMVIACQYYKNGDYVTGDGNYNKGLIEHNKGDIALDMGGAYGNEADNLLLELYILYVK